MDNMDSKEDLDNREDLAAQDMGMDNKADWEDCLVDSKEDYLVVTTTML